MDQRWTPELETARVQLCDYLVGLSDHPGALLLDAKLPNALREAEAALTLLGEIAVSPGSQLPVLGADAPWSIWLQLKPDGHIRRWSSEPFAAGVRYNRVPGIG